MAAKQYYNRYSNFIINGEQTVVPYINLPQKTTDKKIIYKAGQSRLDKISPKIASNLRFWSSLEAARMLFLTNLT
jgi:hypothetical protein